MENNAVADISCRKIFLKKRLGDVFFREEDRVGDLFRKMTQSKQMGVGRGHRTSDLIVLVKAVGDFQ